MKQAPAPASEAKKKEPGAYSTEQLQLVSEAVSLLFASSPSKIKKEREALEQLKGRKEERKEEAMAGSDKMVNTLETKLDKMIANLDKEMNKVDQRAHTLMSIIDTNHDGTLPLSCHLLQCQVASLLIYLRHTPTGHISSEEFMVAVSHLKAKYSPEDVVSMWKKLDTNNDGQISFEQLEQIYAASDHHEQER